MDGRIAPYGALILRLKSWAMTGWRMGWLTFSAGCTEAFEKLILFNTSGGLEFMQAGAIAALTEGEPTVAALRDHARRGRAVVNGRLAQMPRVRNISNSGSFYALFAMDGVADTMSFCKRAVREERIGMAPGTSFGRGAERLMRLCCAKQPEMLAKAMDRLGLWTGVGSSDHARFC